MKSRNLLFIQTFFWVWLFAVTALAETVKVTDNAREHFKAGLAYLEEPTGAKYEEAYREFHAAYAESPSYKILNNIALCALYLERDGEAIDAYERYLAAAPKEEIPSKKREQIDSDLKRLKAGLVKLELKVVPANAVLVDERKAVQGSDITNRYTVTNGALSLGIHPGVHRLTLSAEGYAPQSWEFEAAPATTQSRTVTLVALNAKSEPTPVAGTPPAAKPLLAVTTPPETPKAKNNTRLYVSAAATGVFAASATVTGLIALSKKSDLEKLNEEQTNHQQAVDTRDEAKRYALFCDISLGATVLAAGATAYFIFTAPKTETRAASTNHSLEIAPVIGTKHTGVAVFGSF